MISFRIPVGILFAVLATSSIAVGQGTLPLGPGPEIYNNCKVCEYECTHAIFGTYVESCCIDADATCADSRNGCALSRTIDDPGCATCDGAFPLPRCIRTVVPVKPRYFAKVTFKLCGPCGTSCPKPRGAWDDCPEQAAQYAINQMCSKAAQENSTVVWYRVEIFDNCTGCRIKCCEWSKPQAKCQGPIRRLFSRLRG